MFLLLQFISTDTKDIYMKYSCFALVANELHGRDIALQGSEGILSTVSYVQKSILILVSLINVCNEVR